MGGSTRRGESCDNRPMETARYLPDLLAARTLPALRRDELQRYGRHLSLSEVGMAGQQRLKASRVLLIGVGGLGSPLAYYLAAAGIGRLGLVDDDRVEASNLQRQILYGQGDVGRPKVDVAKRRIGEVNPLVSVETFPIRFNHENARDLIEAYDLVIDGSDNFTTRYLANDACVLYRKPLVWGAVQRFEGQVAVFWAEHGPCYRCLFPEPPPLGAVPSCAEAGVLGVLPGIVGSLQASEAIKLLLGEGEPLLGRLLLIDALGATTRTVHLDKSPTCPICGPEPSIDCLVPVADTCQASAGDEADTGSGQVPLEIDVRRLAHWLDHGRDLVLLDVREPFEHRIGHLDGSRLIPLGQVPERIGELDREALTVVHCHHGGRSAQVVAFLRRQGFERATNLAGGVDAWSLAIDPSFPRY